MAFNFATYGQRGGDAAAVELAAAESLAKQVNLLLAQVDSSVTASSTTAPSASSAVPATLETSQLARRLATLSNSGTAAADAASASLRKLGTKAHSLISSHVAKTRALSAGYSLALQLAEQNEWTTASAGEDVVERFAQEWVTAILTYLTVTSGGHAPPSASIAKGQEILPDASVLQPALRLALDHILAPSPSDRPEYARTIVTPNLARIAGALVASLEATTRRKDGVVDIACFAVLARAVTQHIASHPSVYRPFVARIHGVVAPIITSSDGALLAPATQLLAALYLTGALNAAGTAPGKRGGDAALAGSIANTKASQAQLWHATVCATLASTREAWEACVSTFALSSSSATRRDKLPFAPVQDDTDALARFERLLGTETSPGVLASLLLTPTRKQVPIPLASLVALPLAILAVTADTPSQPAVEADVHALQTMRLPLLHLRALRFLSTVVNPLVKASGAAACARFGPRLLDRLVRLVERSNASTTSAVRAAAAEALAHLLTDPAIPLDPSSSGVLRATRVCLGEISHLLASSTSVAAPTASTSSSGKKRTRLYDSDSLLSNSSSPSRYLHLKPLDEQRSAIAALAALPRLYAHVSTSLTPAHYDAAHATVQLTLALTELLLRSSPIATQSHATIAHWSTLASASLASLTALVEHSSASTPLLAPLVTRASTIATHARGVLASAYPAIARQVASLATALRGVSLPRLPPVPATQVDRPPPVVEEDGRAAWDLDPETGREATSATGGVRSVNDLARPVQVLEDVADAVKNVAGAAAAGLGIHVGASSVQPALPASPSSPSRRAAARHSSPARAQTSTDHAGPVAAGASSPDPVKPLHRPTTPKIGNSPSRRSASASGVAGVVPPAPGSPEAREIFGGGSGSASAAGGIVQQQQPPPPPSLTTPADTQVAPTASAPVAPIARRLAIDLDDDDIAAGGDSDEEMPEIDIRSDDDEDDE